MLPDPYPLVNGIFLFAAVLCSVVALKWTMWS
jgi:hypothetical protein